jgi:hypothetical protein
MYTSHSQIICIQSKGIPSFVKHRGLRLMSLAACGRFRKRGGCLGATRCLSTLAPPPSRLPENEGRYTHTNATVEVCAAEPLIVQLCPK